ncbi:hypothetical protein ACFC06_22495 [Nocardia sp. NPDC056064]|uniref:DUF7373 family lipoprotein n=1 Tax=Nocardia sp. NPDC056064 TaxID=3345701 RepID=UPI0035D72C91
MRALLTNAAASLALITFGVSGCGGEAAPETPQTAPIDLAALDVGSFGTTPRTIGIPNVDRARLSEGQRLGNFLPTPSEVDSRFAFQSGIESTSVFGFIERVYTIGDSDKFKEDTPGFVAGFYSWAISHEDILIAESISNTTMIFDSEASATAAAVALARRKMASKDTFVPVELRDFPSGQAFWDPTRQEIFTFRAYRQFVVYTTLKDNAMLEVQTTNLDALTSLAIKNYTAIQESLQEFVPTPPENLTEIAMDHDELLGHSLARPENEISKNPPGIYDGRGALHLSSTPIEDKKLFEEAGLEWLGVNGAEIYQAKDARGADLIATAHSALNKTLRSTDAPKGLPATKCSEMKVKKSLADRYHCTLAFDRYVIETRSNQLIDAHQRLSAQYALLAAKVK